MSSVQTLTRRKLQLELNLEREFQPDRNLDKGGRSFYFFDLDDNVLYLPTPMYVFHRKTGEELKMSTGHFAQIQKDLGKSGYYKDFEIDLNAETGSYRQFRDFGYDVEPFEQDILEAISDVDYHWKGPSWQCFYHATFNQRPLSIITARGHSPDTIKKGLSVLHREKLIDHPPNYLGVFPVSHPDTRALLGDTKGDMSIPDLKRRAIHKSVEIALRRYGKNPYHRFGMSDDDPKNLELIRTAMSELKEQYSKNSFFVFSIIKDEMFKEEVFSRPRRRRATEGQQLPLFQAPKGK